MIKQLVIGFALSLAASASAQEVQQPQVIQFVAVQNCTPLPNLLDSISKYNEEPLFQATTITQNAQTGRWYQGRSMMLVNWETTSFTFVTVYPDGIACIQATGSGFEPWTQPPTEQ